MDNKQLRDTLSSRMKYSTEFNSLLGNGKGTTRRCFNKNAHSSGDKNPSLSFSPEHGGWKCHSCGEKGDIFTLYMRIHNVAFPVALKYYLEKYHLEESSKTLGESSSKSSKGVRNIVLGDPSIRTEVKNNSRMWFVSKGGKQRSDFMFTRYGLTEETLKQYRIGYSSKDYRVWIPIFKGRHTDKNGQKTAQVPSIVNVRRHDCFRSRCHWVNMAVTNPETGAVDGTTVRGRPPGITLEHVAMQELGPWHATWKKSRRSINGKVLSIAGHGKPYLYPAQSLLENSSVYVVGGELKALLMCQVNRPAVSFTGGEGSYSEEWLPHFIGKSVRVLFDADPGAKVKPFDELDGVYLRYATKLGRNNSGLSSAEEATIRVAQVLANNGAYVEAGFWPEEVKKALPAKGDVTDFLRMCGWVPEGLEHLMWVSVHREYEQEKSLISKQLANTEEIPPFEEMERIPFTGLVNTDNLNKWVKVECIISGRGESPFVVPKNVNVSCEFGSGNPTAICGKCTLPKMGYNADAPFPTRAQVELVGMSDGKTEENVCRKIGVARGCKMADVKVTPSAVELVLMTPTVDHDADTDHDVTAVDGGVAFEFAHRSAYMLAEGRIKLEENTAYIIGGKIISDPKKGTFTLAAVHWEKSGNSALTYIPSEEKNEQLDVATRRTGKESKECGTEEDRLRFLINDLRDHVVAQIYGQDLMIKCIALSWFMPFVFRLGTHVQERVCPNVMILGDTTVGKSTTVTKLMRHWGAGRPYSANSDPTYAGLIGGVTQHSGGRSSFAWGVLPAANMTMVALDEYNKLNLETIGKMTDVLSSGVAQRTTVSGANKTRCWVRFLNLCNPRGERRLRTYSDPMHAALQVAGTVQDLGRFDYVHIQHQLPPKKLNEMLRMHVDPEVEHLYERDIARYHLQWVWSRTVKTIVFEDSRYVFRRAMDLADKYGSHTLMIAAQARFKLARVAAGFASMLFSHDEKMNLVVTNEHVEIAVGFFEELYDKYISHGTTEVTGVPQQLAAIFDQVQSYRRLLMLSYSDKWSRDDLSDAFGGRLSEVFITSAQFELGLITRDGRNYKPKLDSWPAMIEHYVNERDRAEDFIK